MFIGSTGTPLLRSDRESSRETFGPYVGEPYRFDEAVEDGVLLDLRYEARGVDQRISAPDKIGAWLEAKTKGVAPVAKAALKQRWGTLQSVLSSKDRLEQIASGVIMDMKMKLRLKSGMGNAMLVAGSIPEACRSFEIFRKSRSVLAGKCSILTSYKRAAPEITGEETRMGEIEKQYAHRVYQDLLGQRSEDDTYIRADASKVVSHLDDVSLMDLVSVRAVALADDPSPTARKKRENIAEAIENNVRKLIIDESPVNPRFYERMPELLIALVQQRRTEAIAYAE